MFPLSLNTLFGGGGTSAYGILISVCECPHDNGTYKLVHEGDDPPK